MLLVEILVTMATVTSATSARCQCLCCGSLCGKVLIYLMFVLTVCSAINNTNEIQDLCNGNAISPQSAYFLEGEDIVLTCSTQDIPAESLTFVPGGRNAEVISDEYIHKLNETSIKMIIPNVTAKDIEANKGSTQYNCVNKTNITQCYDNVHLRLEYYPREPVDLDCRIYDFDEMTCTWSLGVKYQRSHDIDVTCEVTNFFYKSDNPKASWASCPDQNRTACHWNSSTYQAPYSIWAKVSVTVKERNITKAIQKEFKQEDIVIPGAVEGLSVHRAQGARCVKLHWKPSRKSTYHTFRFNVSYSSACTPEQSRMVYYNGNNPTNMKLDGKRILCDLSPYTEYTYSVIGQHMIKKERDNQTLIPKGYWSSPVVITTRTSSDVLDSNPTMTAGLYEIRPDYDSLILYWTPLRDCDLHDAADNVNYRITAYNETQQTKHPNFMATINVPKSTTFEVTLLSVNSIGPGPSVSVITVFSSDIGLHSSQLVIEYNETYEECITKAEIIVSENLPYISDVFHTLVWCTGTQFECQEPVKWKRLNDNETSFTFDGNLCDVDHRYGLVTHGYHRDLGEVVDSGIHWDPCIYQLGKVAEVPPSNVHLTEIQPDDGFSVAWNLYNCDDVKAYITHYMVTYCVGQVSENCKCTEDVVNVNVSRQNSSYIASDLKAGSQYCVWVRGVSKAGIGPAVSKPLSHKVSSKSDNSSAVMIVIVILAVVVVIVIAVIIIRVSCKKYNRWRDEYGQIKVDAPEHELEERGLLDETSKSITSSGNNSGTQADEDQRIGPGDRTYSIGDIIAGLEKGENQAGKLTGTYNEPEDINSYLLAGQDSGQASTPESGQASAPVDDDVCDQNAPLIKSGDQIPYDPHVTERSSVNRLEEGQLIMINGREYIKKHDKSNADRDHYKSISSVLSDAHSDPTGLSVEDLHSDRNSKDINAILPNFHEGRTSAENIPMKTMKGKEITWSLRENGEHGVKDHKRDRERELDSNEIEQMNKGKDIYSEQVDDNLLTTDDVEKSKIEKNVGDVISEYGNEIEPEGSDKEIDDGMLDFDDSADTNNSFNQFDNRYKQISDIDLKDSYEISDDNELHNEGNAGTINVDMKDAADDLDSDAEHSHFKESADKGMDSLGINRNMEKDETSYADKVFDENVSSKQSKNNNPTIELDLDNDQIRNKLSKNSNGLISKESNVCQDKIVTTGSSNDSSELQSVTSFENSGPFQSYVTAGNGTSSREPNHHNSDNSSQSEKIKSKTKNLNGNIGNKEQRLHTYNEQECR